MSRDGWTKKRARASDDNGWADAGGYMAAKASKLDEQFKLDAPREKQKEGACSNIFSGVAIYVNGYTEPNSDELRRLMMLHGGQYHVYYSRSKTTHIITTNLPNNKIQELKGEKVVRPEWITDSIKAGHLLSYLQYQLYAKQKGLNFPSVGTRQAQETAGPSHGQQQASLQPNLHPPQGPVLSHEKSLSSRHNTSIPIPSHSQLHPGNAHPQPIQHTPMTGLINPQPNHLVSNHLDPQSRHLSPDRNHYSPLPSHPLSNPSAITHQHSSGQPMLGIIRPPPPYSHPQSGLMPSHPSLQYCKPGHTQPQPSRSCNPLQHSYMEQDFKLSGSLQTSSDFVSHLKMNGVQEGGRGDPCPVRAPQGLKEAPLTNGHSHPVNGALKPMDLSPSTEQSTRDTDLPPCRRKSPENKPMSPPVYHQAKPDPYTFPNSPPRRPSHSPVPPHRPSSQAAANQQRTMPPPPTYQEAIAATGSHPPYSQTPSPPSARPCGSDSPPEKARPPSSPQSHSPSPVRLNGSHHNALSSNPASPKTKDPPANTCPPNPPDAKHQSPKPSAQLLAQTGGIISEYYSHSRYHQISTWRIGFSEYVNELHSRRRTAGSATFAGKDRLRKNVAQRPGTPAPPSVNSCILHVDMDCFFVSVGIRHRPELKGKPVAVTSSSGPGRVTQRPGTDPQLEQQYYQRKHAQAQSERKEEELEGSPSPESPVSHANGVDQDTAALSMAEIASCSYEARQVGVRNGMFFGKAKQLCPSLQSVPYDFEAYKDVAIAMYETLASYTHDIEALSCDEVLIDGSALLSELGVSPEELAKAIRADIEEKTGCSASVGMGPNILLARLATRKAKPDGHHFLRSEEVDDFLRDLSVTSLPGVGPVMGRKLAAMGVRSCGDLQQLSLPQLQKGFGPRTGQTLFRFSRGLDDRPVRYEKERKSVSAEMNYNIRFTGVDEAECFMTNLSMEVQRRLREAGLRGRKVTLKVMVRKAGAPLESAKYGGHGICDSLARTVTLAQATDSGQLIGSAVIKLFHAMKLEVQEMRGVGIQVQLLEGAHSTPKDPTGPKSRSIKDLLMGQGFTARSSTTESSSNVTAVDTTCDQEKTSCIRVPLSTSPLHPLSSAEPIPGTSKEQPPASRRTPNPTRTRLNFSIEIPSPSQVDRSVLEALPAELREQVEQSWTRREGSSNNSMRLFPSPQSTSPLPDAQPSSPHSHPTSRPTSPPPPPPPSVSAPSLSTPPVGTLVLQIPNQPGQAGSTGIVLELPDISQVDPDVFAALPRELQDELRSAYSRRENVQPQGTMMEQRNPLLQLKQSGVGVGVGRMKRHHKRKNAGSPAKKGPSPLKRPRTGNSPAKAPPPSLRSRDMVNGLKTENGPSTSSLKEDIPETRCKFISRPAPALAGACDLTDIRTLLREWVTTITEPMEEDILQVVNYCTDLIEDKDLEKLDLIIKYMKRIMQQSVESVWSMAFDFILDNVQVVVQQAYGSTLKIT